MGASTPVPGRPSRALVSIEAGRLWGGGVATGLVAALVAMVGVLSLLGGVMARTVRVQR
jgi:hypothetical protein